ncbi:succinate dehydrogenase / fumarate reductase cytochrome b subunit [Terracoccus luteus]|uniref:Succinate dehydrogenase / fumarate reductase cytochrome b subunit n=2 Tax=Terracoccus luteus TaxID=53356 RepID=A0A839PRV6_9MICO|nr:succinate dehydrogenase / fumarate reductase cytochrome b subunit [Terracoccus luteus]MCP2171186.1 succinate dehydrogenase / fumarate reductase cytochrome b subunit [Terracoccus luteus]
MATKTLPRTGAATARRTTVFMKLVMALSGALFVFYVLAHMYGNLKIFAGVEAYDDYALHLRTLLTPVLPFGGFLWLFRAALLVALVAHAYSAFYLWRKANAARPTRYVAKAAAKATLRSRTMRWGGVALLAFLAWHLIHFTWFKVNPGPDAVGDSAGLLYISSFKVWWVVLIYAVAMFALAMHLWHGVWSASQTLGWATSRRARTNARAIATTIAVVTSVGFILPPLLILVGIVKGS